MSAAFDESDEFAPTEALLRSAADYLEVSSDLRPRVMEAARARASEESAARRNGLLLAAMIVLTLLPGTLQPDHGVRPQAAALASAEVDSLIFASSEDVWSIASSAADGDAAWGLVEAFRQLRVQQSQALRMAF